MQALIEDIELDVQDLKCVLQAFDANPTAALRLVARRNVKHLQERLEKLVQQLDEVPVETVVNIPKIEPVVESVEKVEATPEAVIREVRPEVSAEQQQSTVIAHEESPCISAEKQEAEPAATVTILAEKIRPAADLRHSISLNDSFRFTRELFHGDGALMNETLRRLGEVSSLNEAMQIFSSASGVAEDNEAALDFIELLKKYFS